MSNFTPITVALLIVATLSNSTVIADEQFNRWDHNKDGKLTRTELPQRFRDNFDRVDRNKDGLITLMEHEVFLGRGRNQKRKPRVPESVVLHADISYADNDNPRQKLDLLVPKKREHDKPLPVLAFIHGGGWRAGNKSSGIGRVTPFVANGEFVGVSIGYRLTGEAIWPAQIHDCKAAIRWLRANAKQYNFDADNITVWGSSAGGHLVAMLGVTGDVKELEGSIGKHTDQSSRVRNVIDFFGPTDLLTMNDFPSNIDHDAPGSPESLLVGGPIQKHKDKARHASASRYVTGDDATILIMHGDKDPLVPHDQSVQLHRLLLKAKVNSTFVTIIGGGHGFGGKAVDQRVQTFLDKHALGKKVTVSKEAIILAPRR